MPNVIKIGKTIAEIWQFNGFQNGGLVNVKLLPTRLYGTELVPSWICEIQIL